MTNVNLWQAIDAIVQRLPLRTDTVDAALGSQLTENTAESNQFFRFYAGDAVSLDGGTVVQSIDLRLPRAADRPGFLLLELDGICVKLDAVHERFPVLTVTQTPRGRSIDEPTVQTSEQAWGELSFAFRERRPDCLAYVAFKPSGRQ
jgi:hypothetical protein